MQQETLWGPPGTGKTTTAIGKVAALINAGVDPTDIIYTSFTRVAANVARDRVLAQLGDEEDPDDFRGFATLHALCGRELSFDWRNRLLDDNDRKRGQIVLRDFGKHSGFVFSFGDDLDVEADAFTDALPEGNRLLTWYGWMRQCQLPIDAAIDQWRTRSTSPLIPERAERFVKEYEDLKGDTGLRDFTDILTMADQRQVIPRLRVLFVDEAQDLSPLQWRIIDRWREAAETVILAGDDLQAIYSFQGADASLFLERAAHGTSTVLSQSYRLPRAGYGVANFVSDHVRVKQPKAFAPRDADGLALERLIDGLPVTDPESGSWLFLARNVYLLSEVRRKLEWMGVPYRSRRGFDPVRWYYPPVRTVTTLARGGRVTFDELRDLTRSLVPGQDFDIAEATWLHGGRNQLPALIHRDNLPAAGFTDTFCARIARESIPARMLTLVSKRGQVLAQTWNYLVKMQQRYGDSIFTLTPADRHRVELSTIHAAKGDEADNVVLMTDCARSSLTTLDVDPDSEHRVFYVGVTRAREALYLMPPIDKTHYWPLSTGAWRKAAVAR